MKTFNTNDFIKDIITIINKNFDNKLKIFVERIENTTPEYLFIYVEGLYNNSKGLINKRDGKLSKITNHTFVVNMIYNNSNGSMFKIYEIHDKLCDIMMIQQELITKRYPKSLKYDIEGDSKGVILKLQTQFEILDEFIIENPIEGEIDKMRKLDLEILN